MRTRRTVAGLTAAVLLGLCVGPSLGRHHAGAASAATLSGIHKIQHVVVIMQENRSFDSYFGTYPGADGLPRDAFGRPKPCLREYQATHCIRSYHDPSLVNGNAPHSATSALADIDGGRMDGFVRSAQTAKAVAKSTCRGA